MNQSTTKFTNVNFAERLSLLIAETGQNQKDIAAKAGLSAASITNYLNGRWPKIDELLKLAKYFNVSTDFLLGWEASREEVRTTSMVAGALAECAETDDQKQVAFNTLTVLISDLRENLAKAGKSIEEGQRNFDTLCLKVEQLSGRPIRQGPVSYREKETALEVAQRGRNKLRKGRD